MNLLQVENICYKFEIEGSVLDVKPFGNGHINDTFLVKTSERKYILQKLNHHIFKDVEKMNQNIIKALHHLNSKQERANDFRFRKLEVINSTKGKNYHKDDNGNFWRLMNFISDSVSYDIAENSEIAFEGAKALGYFQKMLIDLNPDDFHPAIENFHNLEMRISAFDKALEKDSFRRKKIAANEIDFVKSQLEISNKLSQLINDKIIPIRVTHNDTKINNVLLDKDTLKGIAVIDLDTVMPGSVLFDFIKWSRLPISIDGVEEN